MMFQVTFTLHGKTEVMKGSRAQVQAMCDYLNKTYRLQVQPKAS
jgi:hypothetical protein